MIRVVISFKLRPPLAANLAIYSEAQHTCTHTPPGVRSRNRSPRSLDSSSLGPESESYFFQNPGVRVLSKRELCQLLLKDIY